MLASLARVTLSGAEPAVNVVQLFFQGGLLVLWLELILGLQLFRFLKFFWRPWVSLRH